MSEPPVPGPARVLQNIFGSAGTQPRALLMLGKGSTTDSLSLPWAKPLYFVSQTELSVWTAKVDYC
jgi:hypothetical protein